MTEPSASVVVSYERFLECRARRRGIVPEPTPHDHSPTTDTTTSSEPDDVPLAQQAVRPVPRSGN